MSASAAEAHWTCHGFVPVTCLITPPWLRTRAGVFGIGATALQFPGFAAHVVDCDTPFLSDTGFRSFLGFTMPLAPGLTVESYIREAITHQVKTELKGQLVRVKARVAD